MEKYSKKGHFHASAIINSEDINSEKGKVKLISYLDTIFLNTFDDESVDLCYWLLSSGSPPDEYFNSLKEFSRSPICGLVWNANFFAYRCRDCGISPCMSLCADCFMESDHKGHDFNMFKSQSGGACDCGDETVMKPSGFCKHHGKANSSKIGKTIPSELIVLPKILIPKMVINLYEKMRINYDISEAEEDEVLVNQIENMITFLDRISQVGVLRDIFCEKIMSPIDTIHVEHVVSESKSEVTGLISCDASNGRRMVRSASTETSTIEIAVGCSDMYKPALTGVEPMQSNSSSSNVKQTFLQYFMEILVKAEFPTKLATLLLQLLPNPTYKETFTRLFCRHYNAFGKSLSVTENPEELSNHMVHFSVQLFSNEFLALKMVKEENLLFKMIFVLSKMVGECLDNFSLEVEGHEASIMAVNCDHKILKGHCYWPVSSDLTNILSHQSVTKVFLETGDCLNRWMHFANMLTGMNVNHLRMLTHIEYEPKTYYTAFSIEFESVASVMWEIYRAILKINEKTHALKMIEVSAAALRDWYSFVPSKLKKPSFTFHLSLHRYFALFVSLAANHFNEDLSMILPTNIVLPAMNYLLSTLAALQEIRSGLWVYNGHQIKCQAQSYMQSYFCNSMLDLDLFFLQIGFLVLDPELMLEMMIDRFGIRHWLQFGALDKETIEYDDTELVMLSVEAFLNTLLLILTHRVYSGTTDEFAMRKDINASLFVEDRTHSQLVEVFPTRPGDTHAPGKCFEQVLSSVATYKCPAVEVFTMQQGMYTPKDEIWENEFDVNHISLRVYKKSEHQTAVARYNAFVQRKGLSATSSVWPPLHRLEEPHASFTGMFRVLKSKTLQRIVIFILHKITSNDQHAIPESICISTVHLIQMMLAHNNIEYENTDIGESCQGSHERLIDLMFRYMNTLRDDDAEHLNIRQQLCEELKKDAGMFSSTVNLDDLHDDVTLVIAEVQHNALFKSAVRYMDSLVSQDFFMSSSSLKHFKLLLSQLTDKMKSILMHLVMHWKYYCKQNECDVQNLPVVKRRAGTTNGKAFEHFVSLLFYHFDYFFNVHDVEDGYPRDAFHIYLPYAGLLDNAQVVLNKHGRLKKQSIDLFCGLYVIASDENGSATKAEGVQPMEVCGNDERPDVTFVDLLLKLKDFLSRSSVPVTSNNIAGTPFGEPTAGDGTFYVDRILKTYFDYKQDDQIDGSPSSSTSNSTQSPLQKKKERRRRASERQKQLLAEFASRQKKFMDSTGANIDMRDDESGQSSQHECVICAQTGESSEEKPLGLIVLMQASRVLGKRKSRKSSSHRDDITVHLAENETCADIVERRKIALSRMFDNRSVRSALECGEDVGIDIQTCGHYIHVHCQISYCKSLQDEQPRLLNAEKGEYICPLCRQLSNGVLPLLPNSIRKLKTTDSSRSIQSFNYRCDEINKFLAMYQQGGLTPFTARALEFTMLTSSVSAFVQTMEDLTKECGHKDLSHFYYGDDWKWTDKYFLLLASLRHNVEMELLMRSQQECLSSKKNNKSCLGGLLEIFHFHAQYVSSPLRLRWNELCYGYDKLPENTPAGKAKSSLNYNDVPLLLVDTKSLLIQFLMTWPQRLSMEELQNVIQICFQLVFVQALFSIGMKLEKTEKKSWSDQAKEKPTVLSDYAGIVWKYLSFFNIGERLRKHVEITQTVVSVHTIENNVQEYCVPYLRLASFIQSSWNGNLDVKQPSKHNVISFNFDTLVKELGLGNPSKNDDKELLSVDCLLWPRDNPHEVISQWCTAAFEKVSDEKGWDIFVNLKRWDQPKLIELPKLYESLFQRYRKRVCARCETTPRDPTVCLVCGEFLCFHASCCVNSDGISECVQHSLDCGCGTGVFLVISSSSSVVIRESRVTLWGSVYLDSFGEEDRDLKRGKPLFLSEERYARLEEEWRTNVLDRSSRKWGLHINRL